MYLVLIIYSSLLQENAVKPYQVAYHIAAKKTKLSFYVTPLTQQLWLTGEN